MLLGRLQVRICTTLRAETQKAEIQVLAQAMAVAMAVAMVLETALLATKCRT
jgi:hypothetical protein